MAKKATKKAAKKAAKKSNKKPAKKPGKKKAKKATKKPAKKATKKKAKKAAKKPAKKKAKKATKKPAAKKAKPAKKKAKKATKKPAAKKAKPAKKKAKKATKKPAAKKAKATKKPAAKKAPKKPAKKATKKGGTKKGQTRKTARPAYENAPLTEKQAKALARFRDGKSIDGTMKGVLKRKGFIKKDDSGVTAKGNKVIEKYMSVAGVAAGSKAGKKAGKKKGGKKGKSRKPYKPVADRKSPTEPQLAACVLGSRSTGHEAGSRAAKGFKPQAAKAVCGPKAPTAAQAGEILGEHAAKVREGKRKSQRTVPRYPLAANPPERATNPEEVAKIKRRVMNPNSYTK